MTDVQTAFIGHLHQLATNNRAAMAELRRSLSFEPGAHPKAFPYVEPFVAAEAHELSAGRRARYLVAGLFALHSEDQDVTVAQAFGRLWLKQEKSPAIEQRFIGLLECDHETLPQHLRQCIQLLKAHDLAVNYQKLLIDLEIWLNPHIDPQWRDRIRQRWACDFYRASPAIQGTALNETHL